MNAIQLLKEDHKQVKQLLGELEATTTRAVKKRSELLARIHQALQLHTRMEEDIFYPAFRQAAKREDKMYFEALEEHRAVEDLVLPDLLATDPGSEKFSGRAKVLRELIEHHVKEEEQQMFKLARELFDTAELRDLGRQMLALKQDIFALEDGKEVSVSVLERVVDVGEAAIDGAVATAHQAMAAARGKSSAGVSVTH